MKKIVLGALVAASVYASGAFAADNTATLVSNSAQVILSDCSLLADDVTISLSNGVTGAYYCRTGAAGVADGVRMATCHTSGRKASRTVETPCGATPLPACTGEGNVNVSTATGSSIYIGDTSGGAIGPQPLDGTLCDDAGAAVVGKLTPAAQ